MNLSIQGYFNSVLSFLENRCLRKYLHEALRKVLVEFTGTVLVHFRNSERKFAVHRNLFLNAFIQFALFMYSNGFLYKTKTTYFKKISQSLFI